MHTDLYFRSKVKLHIWSLEAIEPRCPEGKFDLIDLISTHMCEKWTLDSKSAHQITLEITETRKNVRDVIRGH